MRDNYIKLIDFVFGKYMFTIMKNNDKVLYFEVVDNKYVQPITSFNLYDNEGKSLTNVNEHFFMNQLVSRINVACKKGIFISDQEIFDFLSKIKNMCNDLELKKLFKGSYMNEINEFNFENNKKNILKYLDKFKFDTFVDYSSVSVFDGSLEKEFPKSISNDILEDSSALLDVGNSNNTEEIDVLDDSFLESENDSSSVSNSVDIDFVNIPVDNSNGDVVNSSDYFSGSQVVQSDVPFEDKTLDSNVQLEVQDSVVDSSIQENTNQENLNQDNSDSTSSLDLTAPLDFNSLYSHNDEQPIVSSDGTSQDNIQMVLNSDFSNSIPNTGLDYASVDNVVQPIDINQNIESVDVESNNEKVSFSNDGFSLAEPFVENSVDFNLNNNNVMYSEQISAPSYVSDVKSRIESSVIDSQLGVMNSNVTESDLDKTVITDKVSMPELDSVSDVKSKKNKKNKSFGVVIFIIILLTLLVAFAYFLYNYIF